MTPPDHFDSIRELGETRSIEQRRLASKAKQMLLGIARAGLYETWRRRLRLQIWKIERRPISVAREARRAALTHTRLRRRRPYEFTPG
jgi:hypothetical protein